MRKRSWVLLAALVATGCASPGTVPNAMGSVPPPEVVDSWESCAVAAPKAGEAAQDRAAMPMRESDFAPVAVTICDTGIAPRPDGGEDMTATERRAEDPAQVAALIGALRLPDEPPSEGACTADAVILPFIALHDAGGRWVRPGVPIDACGKPRIEVRQALDALTTTTVAETPVSELTSGLSATSGCSDDYADMIWVTASFDVQAAPQLTLPDQTEGVRLCVYQVAPEERGTGKPRGDLTAGGPLDPAAWSTLRAAFPRFSPAAACTEPATAFAIVSGLTGNTQVFVELDNCHRVMTDGAAIGSGGADLARAVREAAR